jgi:multisubunit Na+/H+ antiporter MnhB subunit
MERVIDAVVCLVILGLAVRVIGEREVFRAVVLFIAMGLMLSLAWVRLRAPDIALAEAAIGAGLTGVLLIRAVQTRSLSAIAEGASARIRPSATIRSSIGRFIRVSATAAFAAVLGSAAWQLSSEPGGLTQLAAENMDASGVEHGVTAVLLNFRAYDTWLEIGVLLLAAMGVLAVHRAFDLRETQREEQSMRVLSWLARVILPLGVLIAGYVYWSGTHAPGGAFQAGAIVAAALVLLALAGLRNASSWEAPVLSSGLVLSFAVFLGIAAAATVDGGLLKYRGDTAGLIIVGLELTIVISTAVTLAALFAGAGSRAPTTDGQERRRATPEHL